MLLYYLTSYCQAQALALRVVVNVRIRKLLKYIRQIIGLDSFAPVGHTHAYILIITGDTDNNPPANWAEANCVIQYRCYRPFDLLPVETNHWVGIEFLLDLYFALRRLCCHPANSLMNDFAQIRRLRVELLLSRFQRAEQHNVFKETVQAFGGRMHHLD